MATDSLTAEHRILREGTGLYDRSERGKLALTGSDVVDFLNGQVTNELSGLKPGEGCYAAFLTHKGKMLGDLRILALGGSAGDAAASPATVTQLLLDTERVALQGLFDMIRRSKIGYDVQLHKRTLECGMLSLIGPGAELASAAEDLPAAEHASASVQIAGVAALAVRTDVGIDLICDAPDTERLREELLQRGAAAVSEPTVECLRVEHGRPRYGIDINETTIPQEAGLNERAVSFTKGCYVGQETVARLHYKGKPNRFLRGLRMSGPATSGDQTLLGDRAVGSLGSVAQSPQLGWIALAMVRREAQPGTTVNVGEGGAGAEVVELPFVER